MAKSAPDRKKPGGRPTRVANPTTSEPAVDPRFAPVVDAFRRDADVTAGVMMSAYGLKVHGRIFAMCPRGVFVVKLPKARVDALVQAGQGDYFDPGHGRLMKQWIAMDGHEGSWVELAREAKAFVVSAATKG